MSIISCVGEVRSIVEFVDEHKSIVSLFDDETVGVCFDGIVPVDTIIGVSVIVLIDTIVGSIGREEISIRIC